MPGDEQPLPAREPMRELRDLWRAGPEPASDQQIVPVVVPDLPTLQRTLDGLRRL